MHAALLATTLVGSLLTGSTDDGTFHKEDIFALSISITTPLVSSNYPTVTSSPLGIPARASARPMMSSSRERVREKRRRRGARRSFCPTRRDIPI